MDWIKIEDKAPPFGKLVLLYVKGKDADKADCGSLKSIDKDGYNWDFGYTNDLLGLFGGLPPLRSTKEFKPTHWCEIIPPKEQ